MLMLASVHTNAFIKINTSNYSKLLLLVHAAFKLN